MTQDEALAILKTGTNVFLTGEPGSGKTHTINQYILWLRKRGVASAITASTGIAATHINGYTIHSWSGIGVRKDLPDRDLNSITKNRRVAKRIRTAQVLIIDEISMLSAQTLAMVEAVCRRIRHDERPFGGLQVVLVGDFFQLPPVSPRQAEGQEILSFGETNPAQFAYTSSTWGILNPVVCYLSEQHRQEDPAFLELLLAIRRSAFLPAHRALLRKRYAPTPRGVMTQLYSHNADVDRINDAELAKISGQTHLFEMVSRGPEQLVAGLKRGCLSPEHLKLKINARVMFTKNDVATHRFVNGTLGVVAGFSKETGYPIVRTNMGRIVHAEPMEWGVQDGNHVLAAVSQIPLRLAWAITVHKSQGMSLDAAHMDLSDAFEYGQGYVALSRVRTLAGLSLAGLNDRALEVHPEILTRDAEFREQSQETRERLAKLLPIELTRLQNDFLRICGGTVQSVAHPHDHNIRNDETHSLPDRRESRWEQTLALIAEGQSIETVARIRGRTRDTILKHLEMLQATAKLQSRDIAHLADGQEQAIANIHAAFRSLGTQHLKPVFDHLNGRVHYETIRLARLLFESARSSDEGDEKIPNTTSLQI